jgi:hypothetical protein
VSRLQNFFDGVADNRGVTTFYLLHQGQSSTGLAYDLALVRIQIHEFKSVAMARLTAQKPPNPDRAPGNGHGEFQTDWSTDIHRRDEYAGDSSFADIQSLASRRPSPFQAEDGHMELRVDLIPLISPPV